MKLKRSETAFLTLTAVIFLSGIVLLFISKGSGNTRVTPQESSGAIIYSVDIINSASKEDFMQIPGIGDVKADNIIAFRKAVGGFKNTEQLKDVSGISDAIYAKIIDYFYSEPIEHDEDVQSISSLDSVDSVSTAMQTEPVTAVTSVETSETKVKTKKSVIKTSTEKSSDTESSPEVMSKVDINSASKDDLVKALLISENLADEIISLRETIHYYSSVEELYLIDGMDKNTYQRIKDFILID